MAKRTRCAVVCALGLAISLALTSCSGFWNTPLQLAKLFVSDVVVTGSQGMVVISVVDMPDGGVASIDFGTVGDPAIIITGIDETTIAVEGLNGFTELAWQFTATDGTLIAANANTGVVSGQILKITFVVTGANPTFRVPDTNTTKVKIGSDFNTLITATTWTLGIEDYYTK